MHLTISADGALTDQGDPQADKDLAVVEEIWNGRSTPQIEGYTVGGKVVSKLSDEQQLELLKTLRAKVWRPSVMTQVREQVKRFEEDHPNADIAILDSIVEHIAAAVASRSGAVSVRAEVRIAVHATT